MKVRKSVAGTPVDPTLEFASVEIDGETFNLIWDFAGIARAEKMTGCNLMRGIMAAISDEGMNAEQFRGLFFAAVTKAHPGITLADVDRLIRPDTIPAILSGLVRAWNNSVPQAKRDGPTEGGAAPVNS